jgi:hypothetical protein
MQDVIALASHLRRVGDRAACGAGIATADLHEALTAYQKQRQAELRARATEAARSALWFESVARYTNLTPSQFAAVLHARRAPLLSLLPPPLFCYLHALRRQVGVIDKLRSLADR